MDVGVLVQPLLHAVNQHVRDGRGRVLPLRRRHRAQSVPAAPPQAHLVHDGQDAAAAPLYRGAHVGVVRELDLVPLEAFRHQLLLLLAQCPLHHGLVQLLVGVVDHQLLKAVVACRFGEAVKVYDAYHVVFPRSFYLQ